MQKPLFLTLLFNGFLAVFLHAQIDTDSLKIRLRETSGAERIEVLLELATASQRSAPAQSLDYAREALALLRAFPNPRIEVDALHRTSRAFIQLSAFDSAAVYAERAEAIASVEGYAKGRAEAANLRGTIQSMQGFFDRGLVFFLDALAVWEDIGDREGLGNVLNNIGIVYMRLGNYDDALAYHLRALAIWEDIGDKEGIARVLNNTGNVHRELGNLDEALDFYRRTEAIREEIGDRRGLAAAFNNIGIIHSDLGHTNEALDYYMRALAIWEAHADKNNLGRVYGNISEIHAKLGHLDEALDFATRALSIHEEIGDRRGAAISLNSIAHVQRSRGNESKALEYLLRARTLAEETGEQRLSREIYGSLSDIYESRGDFKQALAAFKLYKAAHDSLFNAESQSVVAELQTRYQTQEQQQQIALLQRERQIQTLWGNILLGGLLLLTLIAFLIYSRYRFKNHAHRVLEKAHADLKTTQAQLIHQEKMASLGQLTAGIAHEIKNPLNFVTNFAQINKELVQELRQTLTDDTEAVEELLADLDFNAKAIAQHGNRADNIVKNMMQHANGIAGDHQATDLNELVEEYVILAFHGKRARQTDFIVEIEQEYDENVGEISLAPQEMGRVLLNLIGNAFDAVENEPRPRVEISTKRNNGRVEIRVHDNGPGIPDQVRDRVFEPFFTTKPPGKGTGLGLSLAYDIVKQGHGGTLELDTGSGQGTTFVVSIPDSQPVSLHP